MSTQKNDFFFLHVVQIKMYVSHEESIQPFQKVFLGIVEIVGYKMSDTPQEVKYIWKATEITLDKRRMAAR